jgi:hypothetical protein
MIAEDFRPLGLHPKSEADDQASAAPHRLVIKWTTTPAALHDPASFPVLEARK